MLRQRGDLVVRAAELERAAALEALGLEVHRRAREPVERSRGEDRRAVRDAVEPRRRRLDVGELDQRHGLALARRRPKPQSVPSRT